MEFWTVKDVAKYCAVKPRTVYEWVARDVLVKGTHYYKPPQTSRLRFDPARIREWFTKAAH